MAVASWHNHLPEETAGAAPERQGQPAASRQTTLHWSRKRTAPPEIDTEDSDDKAEQQPTTRPRLSRSGGADERLDGLLAIEAPRGVDQVSTQAEGN